MQFIVQIQGWSMLLVLLIVAVLVKGHGAGSRRALASSIGLVVISALYLVYLQDIESLLRPLVEYGTVSRGELESIKATIALWNVLAPLIAGGVGVNLFTSWLTFVPSASRSDQ
jgi:hypothetical protein